MYYNINIIIEFYNKKYSYLSCSISKSLKENQSSELLTRLNI